MTLPLAELQRRFRKAVCSPAEDFTASWLRVREGGPIPLSRRLDIYQYAYFARIEESLVEDFPRLHRRLGAKAFSKMARAFLDDYPSRYASLAEVSQHLPDFVGSYGPTAKSPELKELARFEWLSVLALVAPEPRSRGPKDDGVEPADPVFELHPSARFFESPREVDKPVGPKRPIAKKPVRAVIWRSHGEVISRRMRRGQRELLEAIAGKKRLSELLPTLESLDVPETSVARWFSEWARLGLVSGIS